MANFSLLAKLGVDTKGFQSGLDKAKSGVSKFRKNISSQLGKVAAAFGGVKLIKSIVGLGTAAAETASKFEAVFGPAVDEMNKKVQELRKTIPSTTAEMQDALATFAQMAKAFGLNSKSANMFSVEMVKIAGDIASFNNLPIEEAFTKIRSAISGEFEPMKQLGIVINETRLKQEGLNLAIWDGTGQMSAAQKALAVQSILIRDMGDANGDAALTANSAANQIKFLQKSLKETGTEIGQTILPAVVALTQSMAKLINVTKNAMEAVGEFSGKLAFGDPEDEMRFARGQAMRELRAENAFEGVSKGEKHRMIEKRAKDILALMEKQKEKEREITKERETEKKKQEKLLKTSKDLGSELKKQIAAETDPARKKALEERLSVYSKLLEAAGKLNSLESVKKPGGDNAERNLKGLKKKTLELQRELARAQADGDRDREQALQRQLEIAKKVAELMGMGFGAKEAGNIAKSLASTKGDFVKDLKPKDLVKAANEAAKEDGRRFQRLADGTFQEFINGSKGKIVTEEQLKKAVEAKIESKPTEKLLEQIKMVLEGKFVNE